MAVHSWARASMGGLMIVGAVGVAAAPVAGDSPAMPPGQADREVVPPGQERRSEVHSAEPGSAGPASTHASPTAGGEVPPGRERAEANASEGRRAPKQDIPGRGDEARADTPAASAARRAAPVRGRSAAAPGTVRSAEVRGAAPAGGGGPATDGLGHNPPGNNGTIHLQAPGVDTNGTTPHIDGCAVTVVGSGFDAGQVLPVRFSLHAPTGAGVLATSTVSADGDGVGRGTTRRDLTATYDLRDQLLSSGVAPHPEQGYHVRVEVGGKKKMVWLTCAGGTESVASRTLRTPGLSPIVAPAVLPVAPRAARAATVVEVVSPAATPVVADLRPDHVRAAGGTAVMGMTFARPLPAELAAAPGGVDVAEAGGLARTGASTAGMTAVAAALVALGSALRRAARRPRTAD